MIIKTFNPVFFGLFIIFGLFTLCLKLCLKRADERQRQLFVAFFYTAILVYFFVYKYQLSKDVEYSGIQALSGAGNFSWWTELPLNLCNISLVVIPLAFFFKKALYEDVVDNHKIAKLMVLNVAFKLWERAILKPKKYFHI